jgi:hypothetical protein
MKDDPVFRMRVPPEWLVRLDEWRIRQRPVPDRSKAARMLLDRVVELEARERPPDGSFC